MSEIILEPQDLLPPDMQGWNYGNKIFAELVQQIRPRRLFEVGSWKGMSTINFHRQLEKLNQPYELYCIDTWLGSLEHMDGQYAGGKYPKKYGFPQLYLQFLSNLHYAGCLKNIFPIPNTSITAARYLKNQHIHAELIYIDASHESPDVYHDISNYWDLLVEGGVMFGDDHDFDSVAHDVKQFFNERQISYRVVDGVYWVSAPKNNNKIKLV